MSHANAKAKAKAAGIDLAADFHTLSISDAVFLAELAKACRYSKPRTGSGSRGRYFFYYLATH